MDGLRGVVRDARRPRVVALDRRVRPGEGLGSGRSLDGRPLRRRRRGSPRDHRLAPGVPRAPVDAGVRTPVRAPSVQERPDRRLPPRSLGARCGPVGSVAGWVPGAIGVHRRPSGEGGGQRMRGTARRRAGAAVGAAVLASVIGGLPSAPPAFAGPTPTYVDTIGGGTAGHADMYPSGVDVDAAGNLYVADTGDDQILSFGPAGGQRWVIGTRGAKAPGRFENPRDVAVHAGRVYVADTGYNRVQVLDAADGSVIEVWSHRFGTIMGISAGVNGAGTPVILVSESSSHSIRVHSLAGAFIDAIGTGPGSGAGQLNGVRDAATDPDGNVYAADYANSRFAVFRPSGAWVGAWGVNGTGAGQFKRPYGIDIDDSGDVYVADSNNYVHRFSPTGPVDPTTFGFSFVRAYGRPGTAPGEFSMLRRVAVGDGASPSVYGADLWKFKVEIFGPLGAHLDTVGGGGPANGFFNEPYGVAVDGTNVFVTDMVNQRVQKFSATSPYGFQLAWGERGWGEGNPGMNWPKGLDILTVGGTRTVWVADTKNNRLQEFRPDGTATGRKFGKVGAGIGQLKWPFAVAAYGNRLVVADTNNKRVQLWGPAGPSVVWTSTGGGPGV